MLGSGDRELQHPGPVPRCFGMVSEAGQVPLVIGHLPQRGEDASVKEPAAKRRDGGQDRLASQVMAKGQPLISSSQQAPVDTLVCFVQDRTGHGQQEVCLDARPDDGSDVEHGARFRGEARGAGQDGIANRGGHGFPAVASTSVTKNGLPPVNR